MADIFISYASEDRDWVKPLAQALEDQGWSVWWDRESIPVAKTWRKAIEEGLKAARSILVLWSVNSITKRWVIDEAEYGIRRENLVPAIVDDVRPPMGFRSIQAADLTDWETETSHPGFTSLLDAISRVAGPPTKSDIIQEERRIDAVAPSNASVGQSMSVSVNLESAKVLEQAGYPDETFITPKPSELKPDSPEPSEPKHTEPIAPKPRKTNKTRIFVAVAGILVLLIVGIGIYVIVISKDGFDTIRKSFEIVAGKETRIDVVLSEICRWPPFIPFVPNVSNIALDQKWKTNCHSGEDCIKIGFDTQSESNWGGLHWHANGNESGPGVNLYEFLNVEPDVPIILSFYARGAEGREVVKFQVGGANNEKESVKFAAEKSINLTPDWESYKIELKDQDLSHVVRGFSCIITKDNNPGKDEVWFFLDDLCYRIADK